MYTLSEILHEAQQDFGVAPLDSELLLARLLDIRREDIIAHPERPVTVMQRDDFLLDCQRRSRGEPLAYLLGFKEFYGLPLHVDRRVLIPRPETELLVDIARELAAGMSAPKLCDVGTGSGCIAVALAKHLPHVRIIASDISDDALLVARKNVHLHGVVENVELVQSDLLEQFREHPFDGVVANLPYIGRLEHHLVGKDVMEYEPNVALFGGDEGTELIEKLFLHIAQLRHMPQWCIGEMGFLQKEKVEKIVRRYLPHAVINFKQDLAGLDRVFIITL
ncbi:protein-(glutamine-N5) methyltransferase, release factor-specific [Candidatus Peregrinibacteria bacterium CG11_big_fil_rev_8_21_14_0_20_46_8]|nr:MAG: protein-(glutamine-N5) methyltransferase, release factor-specific [Candidatus Peregrinibacteria bacterium CG11_big_fil_rev_8_21_14_0_20_46_8]